MLRFFLALLLAASVSSAHAQIGPAPGGGSGINQLTGAVTAGPGSGSQAATIPAGQAGTINTGCQATGGTALLPATITISTQWVLSTNSPVVTTPYTINATDACNNLLLNSGASALVLPSPSTTGFGNGKSFLIDNASGGAITWSTTASGGYTGIDGAASGTIQNGDQMGFHSDGTNFHYLKASLAAGVTASSTNTFTNKTLTSSTNSLGGVTAAFGSDAKGDIYTNGGSSNVVTRLGIGSAGNCLVVAAGLPFWASCVPSGAAGGSLAGTYPNPTIASSVALPGSPTTTTQTAGDNTTAVATDAFVTTAVNNAIAGVNPAVAVQVATTAAADTSALTYNNGASGIGATFTGANNTAITIDGVTFTTVGQRLLVKNDTQSPSGAFNGVYSLTAVQTTITGAIFTRALDYDTPSDMNNTGSIPVTSGTANSTTSWLLTSSITTVGTSPLTYAQFSINPTNLIQSAASPTANITATGQIPQANGGQALSQALTASSAFMWWQRASAASTTPGVAGSIYFVQYWIGKPVTIPSLNVDIGTGGAGSSAFAIGLYASSATTPNRVGALLANSAGSTSTSTGVLTLVFSTGNSVAGVSTWNSGPGTISILAPGMYWLAFQYGDTTMRVFNSNITNNTGFGPVTFQGSPTITNLFGGLFGLSVTGAVGTWPNPPTSQAELTANTILPWFSINVTSVP